MMRLSPSRLRWPLPLFALILAALACARADAPIRTWRLVDSWSGEAPEKTPVPSATPTPHPLAAWLPPTRRPGEVYATPTPDSIRPAPTLRLQGSVYVVQPGDSLNQIAFRFGVGSDQILSANGLFNPDLLSPGQVLNIPPPTSQDPGPSFKVIPDSELVYGPTSGLYDLDGSIRLWDGALNHYVEVVEGRERSGAQIVQLVAERYSVNPRLLIALLEYQGGWLTRANQPEQTRSYPIGYVRQGWEGLFDQLSWAADELNTGFYLWQADWAGPYVFGDGSVVNPGPGINAGTAGVQYLFSELYPAAVWRSVVDEQGFYQVYVALFGLPFDYAVEPLVPPGLSQPELQLPFEPGEVWSFTGGPHGGWGNGSAWAALDFAPPGDALGCVLSNAWVVAVADGLIVKSDFGEVVQDLDGDGYPQTGWVILYMHVEWRDRVQAGAYVHAGDRLGHPSCEGGVSTGTHLHLARKYNGAWIPADGDVPFVMDGWVSAGWGQLYDGTLSRGGTVLEACGCRADGNQIWR